MINSQGILIEFVAAEAVERALEDGHEWMTMSDEMQKAYVRETAYDLGLFKRPLWMRLTTWLRGVRL